ncbi:MAG: hypothetical protein LBP89_00660 [Helicobacteraceae bacterium]|nr:hypothetical protein [Helicobacteraceae bacterium]
MDKEIDIAVSVVLKTLSEKYPQLSFVHQKKMMLTNIIVMLSQQYPGYSGYFGKPLETSFITPDGGFIFATNKQGERRIVLVSEVKHQGTNDKRKKEGLPKQAKGNAIERLGKNLIGIKALFKNEGVLPFVCFGNGDDFKEGSPIRDRVLTMNDFFSLNKIIVKKDFLPFEPASMLFRYDVWTIDEMARIMLDVAEQAINYKFV